MVNTIGEIVDFPAIERAAHDLLDLVDVAILAGTPLTSLSDNKKREIAAARRFTGRGAVDPETVSDLELARLDKRLLERKAAGKL